MLPDMAYEGVDPINNDIKLFRAEDMTEKQDLPVGCFSSWLRGIRISLIKNLFYDKLE